MHHAAATGEFTPSKKLHLYRRGQTNFKNVILTEHGKHKKKALLTEHGKHIFEFCNTSAEKRLLFSRHYLRRGVSKKAKCDSHAAWESKKKKFLTEHGKQIFHFCNPSRLILTFLAGFARFWPALAGSGRL